VTGVPGTDIRYSVDVVSPDSPDDVRAMLELTDRQAEVQKTLRSGASVTLHEILVRTE
jgi:hypothetical protein